MVERARAAQPWADYRSYLEGDPLPFDDRSHGVCFAICVFHQVQRARLPELVAELKSICRPVGVIAVFEHNPWSPLTAKAVRASEFDADTELLSWRATLAPAGRGGPQAAPPLLHASRPSSAPGSICARSPTWIAKQIGSNRCRPRQIIWTLAAILTAGALSGCGGSGNSIGQAGGATNASVANPTLAPGTGPCGSVGSTTYDHVIWILMENKSYGSVIGSGSAPFETALARECATAAHWNDAGSDYNSLPNYIALTTGIPTGDPRLDPFYCDCAPAKSVNVTVDNLFRQVRAAGLTEKSYAEGMSGNCSYEEDTTYAPKHNPALYMWGGSDRQACRADDVPMGSNRSGAFIDDLEAGTLPSFSYIAPNLCNDTHDCGVATGDAYLKTLVGNILSSRLYRRGHTAVVVVWDEDTPVPNIVVSPSVHPGTVVASTVSHYSLLRATEDIFGLPRLLSAADAPDFRAAAGL